MPLPKSWTTVTPLSKTIALILFAFLPTIAFFLGVRYQQKLDEPLTKHSSQMLLLTPTPNKINFDMSSWLTLNDKKLGFSLKYPSNLVIRTQSNSSGAKVIVPIYNLSINRSAFSSVADFASITIAVSEVPAGLSLKDIVEKGYSGNGMYTYIPSNFKKVRSGDITIVESINGVPALFEGQDAFIIRGTKLYAFRLSQHNETEEFYDNLFRSILTTFQFTK